MNNDESTVWDFICKQWAKEDPIECEEILTNADVDERQNFKERAADLKYHLDHSWDLNFYAIARKDDEGYVDY